MIARIESARSGRLTKNRSSSVCTAASAGDRKTQNGRQEATRAASALFGAEPIHFEKLLRKQTFGEPSRAPPTSRPWCKIPV